MLKGTEPGEIGCKFDKNSTTRVGIEKVVTAVKDSVFLASRLFSGKITWCFDKAMVAGSL